MLILGAHFKPQYSFITSERRKSRKPFFFLPCFLLFFSRSAFTLLSNESTALREIIKILYRGIFKGDFSQGEMSFSFCFSSRCSPSFIIYARQSSYVYVLHTKDSWYLKIVRRYDTGNRSEFGSFLTIVEYHKNGSSTRYSTP